MPLNEAPGQIEQDSAPANKLILNSFSDLAESISDDRINPAVRRRALYHMLDAVGIAMASAKMDFGHRALAGVRTFSDRGSVPVLGTREWLPPRDAALVNGVLAHGLDFDDTHLEAVVHPTVGVLPAVLSTAVHVGATGREMVTAYLLGVEIACRLGMVAHGAFHRIGFHPTGICNVFGAAVAAGRLLGLTKGELAQAQGIALSQASGALEFLEDGAWTKRMHPGWAASAGMTAAGLAKAGYVGATDPYTGRYGLFRAYLGGQEADLHWSRATEGLGEDWQLLATAIKPFPACHFTHGCIDAALDLAGKLHGNVDRIDRVTALVPEEVIAVVCEPEDNKRRPKSAYDAQFSIPFLVAASLLRGRMSLAELTPDALSDPAILDLAARVDYQADPNSRFPSYYSGEVTAMLTGGEELSARRDKNRGAPDQPLTNEEIAEKFALNAATAVAPARLAAIKDIVLALDDDITAADFARQIGEQF
jgi:2-methylcitrate dehydratase PrpD